MQKMANTVGAREVFTLRNLGSLCIAGYGICENRCFQYSLFGNGDGNVDPIYARYEMLCGHPFPDDVVRQDQTTNLIEDLQMKWFSSYIERHLLCVRIYGNHDGRIVLKAEFTTKLAQSMIRQTVDIFDFGAHFERMVDSTHMNARRTLLHRNFTNHQTKISQETMSENDIRTAIERVESAYDAKDHVLQKALEDSKIELSQQDAMEKNILWQQQETILRQQVLLHQESQRQTQWQQALLYQEALRQESLYREALRLQNEEKNEDLSLWKVARLQKDDTNIVLSRQEALRIQQEDTNERLSHQEASRLDAEFRNMRIHF